MAYTVSSNAVLGVTFRGFVSGQTVMTTLAYRLIGAQPPRDGLDIIALAGAALNAGGGLHEAYMSLMATNYVAAKIDLQWISPLRYRKVTQIPDVQQGTAGAECGTPNIASVITLLGENAGRKNIANKHLPALPNGSYSFGNLSPLRLVNMDQVAAKMTAAINVQAGANLIPIIYNRVDGATSPIITDRLVNEHVRVMRRRTVGLGI